MLQRGSLLGSSLRLVPWPALSATSPFSSATATAGRAGRALETYMRRAREFDAVMVRERAEFDRGKRHLANMMGVDAAALTQGDVDRAIAYLFPSSLTDPNALPVLRPPDEILPSFHKLHFDSEGRPIGTRFYTLKPKFYSLLSEVGDRTEKLLRFGWEGGGSGTLKEASKMTAIPLGGSVWLNETKMAKKIGEKISSHLYGQLILALEHLASLPGSTTQSEFIFSFRESIAAGSGTKLFGPAVPKVEVDAKSNRRTATALTHVKGTYAEVTVSDAGKGEFLVDALPLSSFRSLQAREILLCPLIVADALGQVSVTARTWGAGGESAVPRAVRHAVALALAALRPDKVQPLTLCGLLTHDPRKKERSKVNQPGARAKWIWKRR